MRRLDLMVTIIVTTAWLLLVLGLSVSLNYIVGVWTPFEWAMFLSINFIFMGYHLGK